MPKSAEAIMGDVIRVIFRIVVVRVFDWLISLCGISENPEDWVCPVCGYYCLDNGGFGCIHKKSAVEAHKANAHKKPQPKPGS